MPNHTKDRHREDKTALIECLTLIERELYVVVFERKDLFRKEFVKYLPGPRPEVEHRLAELRGRIESDDLDWEYFEGAGLADLSVKWKRDLIREAANHGVVSRFLHLANVFLGSLAGGLPGAEFVKEYKDFIEGCLKIVPKGL